MRRAHLIGRGCRAIAFLGDASSRYPEFRDRYVALVGFDDIPAASLTRPPLTTIAQDYLRAGRCWWMR